MIFDSHRNYLVALTACLALCTSTAAFAQGEGEQDNDGNMSSVWDEGKQEHSSSTQALPTKLVNDAPVQLSSASAFKESELVKSVSWPGVGPFKADSEGDGLSYVDPQDNKLNIQSEGDRLTSAQLLLVGQNKDAQGLLNLEMVSDFMLEALGIKGKRIAEFNGYLEKNKEILGGDSKYKGASLSTTSGAYNISLKSSNAGTYLIDVRSRGGAAPAQDLTSRINTPAVVTETPVEPATTINVSAPTAVASAVKPTVVRTAVNTTPAVKPVTPPVKPPVQTAPVSEVKPPAAAGSASSDEAIKKELGDALRAWQQHKKDVLKNKDASDLPKYLTGRALLNQKIAVKWLVDKQNHYDMTPKGVTVSTVQKLSDAPRRYSVVVTVKEHSKQIKEPENRVLVDKDDSYNVNYTLEKSDSGWRIADYKLIK